MVALLVESLSPGHKQPITVTDDLHFTRASRHCQYSFHVDPSSGDPVHDHYGAPAAGHAPRRPLNSQGWGSPSYGARREFPDHGRGDFRLPAIRVRCDGGRGHAICHLVYDSHDAQNGKPACLACLRLMARD
jgi:alpha-galactosidase